MEFPKRLCEILFVAIRLGVTSFGGPIAHIGYFREEYVNRRRWLDEESYAGIVSLCQVLPGPTSSQVGIIVGIYRSGLLGGAFAWLGFTLPSAAILILFAFGLNNIDSLYESGWLHGMKIMAVAVVALAIWGMAHTICTDRLRITITVASAITILSISGSFVQIYVLMASALIGWLFLKNNASNVTPAHSCPIGKRLAVCSLVLFLSLLLLLPALRYVTANPFVELVDSFYRTGSLVFGGGHVVLPLLQTEVVETGWVTQDAFFAGYGAAQAIPGPLFTFAAYLGAAMEQFRYPVLSGIVCLIAIFAPSFLLIVGILPFWNGLRSMAWFGGSLGGVNAAVVGLLMAALYDPIWTSSINSQTDFAFAIGVVCLIAVWKCPIWLVVLMVALISEVVTRAV